MHGYRYPAHEARVAELAREAGFRAGLGLARREPAHEDRLARRHDGGRCLPLADPAALRRPGRRRAAGRARDVHAIQRRPHRRAPLPGQGLDPLRARRRHRRHGAHLGGRGLRQGHRLRHGRHLDRRVALRGRARARVRDAGGGRAHARADDVDPHHRGGRRLDPALRRPAPARGSRFRGRQPRARVLPARRPARGHRLQRDAGQDPAGVLSRRCSGRRRTRRSTPAVVREKFAALAARDRAAPPASAQAPEAAGRGLHRASPWRTWPTRSSSSRCSAATT